MLTAISGPPFFISRRSPRIPTPSPVTGRCPIRLDASTAYIVDRLRAFERGEGPDVPIPTMRLLGRALAPLALTDDPLRHAFTCVPEIRAWCVRHAVEVFDAAWPVEVPTC